LVLQVAAKETQSEKLVEKYGLIHLSTGNLLRAEISNQTKLGLEAKSLMDRVCWFRMKW